MAAKPVPLSDYVTELRHTVVVAMQNFDVWWVYKQRRDRSRFVDVLNTYPAFFQASIHAHFVALIMALYRLYETRTDTFNLTEVVNRLETELALPSRKLAGIKRRVENARRLWIKVSILRNEAFGHRSNSRSVSDVFRKAGVTANQLRSLIQKTKQIVNLVSQELDGSSHAFNLRATSDTRRMLTDLEGKAVRSNKALKTDLRKRASPARSAA